MGHLVPEKGFLKLNSLGMKQSKCSWTLSIVIFAPFKEYEFYAFSGMIVLFWQENKLRKQNEILPEILRIHH